jgi:hypothetical protein
MKRQHIHFLETGQVARIGEMRHAHTILVGKPEEERDHLGNVSIDGRITLKWNFKKQGVDSSSASE